MSTLEHFKFFDNTEQCIVTFTALNYRPLSQSS